MIRFTCNRCGNPVTVTIAASTRATMTVAEAEEVAVCPQCRRIQEIKDKRCGLRVYKGGRHDRG